jgi:ribosome-binding factor A
MRRAPTFSRADRLEHLMADEVERLLSYEIRSPLAQKVRVVHARLAKDLSSMRVQYVMLDGTEGTPAVQTVLEQAAGYIARTVQETLQTRNKCSITFHFDRDAMRMQRVQELLDEAKAATAAAALANGDAALPAPTAGDAEDPAQA